VVVEEVIDPVADDILVGDGLSPVVGDRSIKPNIEISRKNQFELLNLITIKTSRKLNSKYFSKSLDL